jgi:hypothetical protein
MYTMLSSGKTQGRTSTAKAWATSRKEGESYCGGWASVFWLFRGLQDKRQHEKDGSICLWDPGGWSVSGQSKAHTASKKPAHPDAIVRSLFGLLFVNIILE